MGIDEIAAPRPAASAGARTCPSSARWASGILLRLSMALLYDARIGYDFNAHWPHIQYIADAARAAAARVQHDGCAPAALSPDRGAAVVALGLGPGALGWLAALWGMMRLVIVWAALEKWLPESRLARVVALATAGVLPDRRPPRRHDHQRDAGDADVGDRAAGGAVRDAGGPRRPHRARRSVWAWCSSLALMSKLTAGLLIVCLLVAIGLEIGRAPSPLAALRVRLRPLLACALVLVVVSGWTLARNRALTGRFAPTAFEGSQTINQAPYETIPYFHRRPVSFYVGWNWKIHVRPFFPSGLYPMPRFFPVLIASTFNDYYVLSYSDDGKYGRRTAGVSGASVTLGCLSVLAGTVIALITVLAWLGAVRALWRRREDGEPDPRFALLLAPLAALLAQLHFATKYPNDNLGPIKGAYMQFVAPVMCALFGRRCRLDVAASRPAALAGGGAGRDRGAGPGRGLLGPRALPAASASTATRPRRSSPRTAPPASSDCSIAAGVGTDPRTALLHRRWRRLHRQPLLRPACWRPAAARPAVTVYDNFTSGREWHFAHHAGDARLRVVRGNVEDTAPLAAAMAGHDVVIHLASNPDIARAATEPTIDFSQGTALTQSVLEAMRTTSAKRILYASGSGVYGDLGTHEASEDHGPLIPVSTYGASKLAGEALIASYAAMFGLSGCAFRFGNVVGPRQTHGVGFDFARALLRAIAAGDQPLSLRVLGDGSQSKSYIHVDDVVRAVLAAHAGTAAPFAAYNVATGDYITVPRDRRAGRRVRRPRARQRALRLHGRRSRLEGRRARWFAWTRGGSGRSAGAASARRARRCGSRSRR